MKTTTLPTLRERWEQLYYDYSRGYEIESFDIFNDYIKFNAQKLALWMFVPCNSKGEPMDKIKLIGGMRKGIDDVFQKEYQKALDVCIFEGWEWDNAYQEAKRWNDEGILQSSFILSDGNGNSVVKGKVNGTLIYLILPTTIEELLTAGIPSPSNPNTLKN